MEEDRHGNHINRYLFPRVRQPEYAPLAKTFIMSISHLRATDIPRLLRNQCPPVCRALLGGASQTGTHAVGLLVNFGVGMNEGKSSTYMPNFASASH